MELSQAETHLVFPKSASVEQLKLIRESIATEREQRLRGGQPVQPAAQTTTTATAQPEHAVAGASVQAVPPAAPQPSSLVKTCSERQEPNTLFALGRMFIRMLSCLQESSMSFFVTLQSNFQHVTLYESPDLQQEARRVIPQQQLLSSAEDNLKKAKDADPGEPTGQNHPNPCWSTSNKSVIKTRLLKCALLSVWFHAVTGPVTSWSLVCAL